MGRIKDKDLYALDQYLTLDDYVIGSDAENLGKTQNYGLRGIFDTFRNALNLTSIEYTFSDGTDPELDETDAGYFTSNNVLAGAVTSLYINKLTLSGGYISSLVDVVSQNVSSFILRLYQPSAAGQVFFFVIDSIVDSGTYFTFNVTNFVGGNTLVDSTTYGVAFDLAGVPSIVNETDPIFMVSPAAGITGPQIINWDAAFLWGNHATQGYLTAETDPVFTASPASGILGSQITNWDTAFTWGDHGVEGYLTVEVDPTVPAYIKTILASDITNWNLAYSWGNHTLAGYLTAETDPVFAASVAAGITAPDISNWDSAFIWGNHALQGYLRDYDNATITGLWDFSNPITIQGVPVSSQVFVTTSTGAGDSGKWTKVATITLTAQYDNATVMLSYINSTNGQEDARGGFFLIRSKQELALGSDPVVAVKSYYLDETSVDIGYVIVQNTPTSVVDIYVQPNNTFTTIHATQISIDNADKFTWYSSQAYAVGTPAGLTEVTTAGLLADAPSDGTAYGRLNGAWSAVSAAWGSITGTLSSQTDLQGALNTKLESVDIADINTTGTASVTSYLRGDGQWTEIVGGGGDVTKVGTPLNNQVGVWTGDGTIEGDENFTWSGTNLYVAGNAQICSIDTGSSASPELSLKRDSASPADGDYLGQIRFDGKNDSGGEQLYAKITGKTSDVSNGTEDGLIETAVVFNGTNKIVSRQTGNALKLINNVGLEVAGDITAIGNISTAARVGAGTNYPDAALHAHETTALGGTVGNSRLITRFEGDAGNDVKRDLYLVRNATGTDWLTMSVHDSIAIDANFTTPQTNTKTWWERNPYAGEQSWGNSATTGMTLSSAGNLDITGGFTVGSTAAIVAGSGGIRRLTTDDGILVGSYDDDGGITSSVGAIYCMGTALKPSSTTNFGNMYGIGYCYGSVIAGSNGDLGTTPANNWGMYVAADGEARLWFNGTSGISRQKGAAYASNFILNSDRRRKTDIEDYKAVELGVKWQSFELDSEQGQYRVGVIAQDLLGTPAEKFVNQEDPSNYTVNYIDLHSAALAQKDKEIEDLTKRLEKLELIIKGLI